MPYIPQDRRADVLAELREHGTHWSPANAGDLNYVITCNEMMGALECCKLELYRRLVGPYEDEVLEANGDAYVVVPTRESEY